MSDCKDQKKKTYVSGNTVCLISFKTDHYENNLDISTQ